MKIKEWAEKTVTIYNPIAKEYNISYYNQSKLDDESHPKILIVGDNPGSDGGYDEMKAPTAQTLLEGNAMWAEREQWRFTQNLYRNLKNLDIKELDNGKDCLFTNATFFGTKRLNSNRLLAELMRRTVPCTIELIKILQPEMIIAFSGDKVLKVLKQALGGDDNLEYRHCIAHLYYGKLNEIPIYGIPHTSASKTFEEWDLTTKAIRYLQAHKGIVGMQEALKNEIEQYKTRVKYITFDIDEAIQYLVTKVGIDKRDILYAKEGKTIRINNLIKEDNLQVTITTTEKKYIAIRHECFDKNYLQLHYPHEQEWRERLEQKGYHTHYPKYWLGQKRLACYGCSTEEIMEGIMEEINLMNKK